MRHPLVALLAGALAIMAACTTAADKPAAIDSSHAAAPADTDDFGAPLPTDARFAARVVSLNPAATEIIFAIGADSALVGRSRWDEFPKEVERIMPVGDGIRPSIETVLSVQPTLVILYATADNRSAPWGSCHASTAV